MNSFEGLQCWHSGRVYIRMAMSLLLSIFIYLQFCRKRKLANNIFRCKALRLFCIVYRFIDTWVLIFIPSYFKWTYGDPSADPSAKLPRPAFLLPREQVQNKSFRELPRSRFFFDFSRSASAVTPGASTKAFSRGCLEVCTCYLYLLVGRAFWQCFWLYWLASQKHILYQSNTFRFRTSQMAHTCDIILGWVNHFSWSYLPYRWARGLSMPLRERFASAKLPQRTWTLLPKTYQDHGHLVFTTAHVKHIANTLHRIKQNMSYV